MKAHYTAKELAGLPGLPTHFSAVIRMADRESWAKQPRQGKGGGWEYALASLPRETQDNLKNQHFDTLAASLPAVRETALTITAKAVTPADSLPEWQRECMDARLGLLRLVKAAVESGISVKPAINKIVDAATRGELGHLQALVPLANARGGKSGSRTLSPRTLLRWWADWKQSGFQTSALVPDGDRQPRPEPTWAVIFMKEWRKGKQKPALTAVLEELKKTTPMHIILPSYDQARRYLASLGALERSKGRSTGLELMSLKSYRRRLTDHMFPGDAYTADGHCFDAEVCHPYTGRPFRPEITPVIDIATRMVVGWSVDLAESGFAVLDALRCACELFGPPVIFYTDNGKGFKNQMMTAPGTGIMNRLGITPEYSRPRNPQAHGISERGHQTILIKAAKQLATYIGKAMDGDTKQLVFKQTRAAIDTDLPTPLIEWQDFIGLINQAIIDYNNRPHTGLPAYRDPATRRRIHYSPYQAWQIGMQRMKAEMAQEYWTQPANELPDLYHPAMERTVDRCWVRMGTMKNGRPQMYYSSDLANWHGERVQVAYCPSDASKVWVRTLDDNMLITVAKLNGNSDDYFAQTKLEEKREVRAKGQLKRVELKRQGIELERTGPQAIVIEHSPAVQAKLAPVEPLRIEAAQTSPVIAPVFSLPPTQAGKYIYWCQIDARINAGEEVNEAEARFHAGFQKTAAWESERMYDPEYQQEKAYK